MRRQHVDDAIGADLARIVHGQPDAGLDARPDDDRLDVQIAPRELIELRAQRRNDARDRHAGDLAGGHAARLKQAEHEHGVFVGELVPLSGEAPVGQELVAAKHAGLNRGVADVES